MSRSKRPTLASTITSDDHAQGSTDAEVTLVKYGDYECDPDRFARDPSGPAVAGRIDRDLASGEHSGVEGTPTFFVNGVRHDGPYDLDSLRAAIVVVLP